MDIYIYIYIYITQSNNKLWKFQFAYISVHLPVSLYDLGETVWFGLLAAPRHVVYTWAKTITSLLSQSTNQTDLGMG